MALIQNPGLGRKLMRALRLTTLPDSVLAPEIVGVILVEDLSAPLSDIDRGCMGSISIGAVVGENAFSALVRVGAPARYDLVVTKVTLSVSAATRFVIAVPTGGIAGLAASGDTNFTDFDIPGRPSSQLGSDTAVGLPAARDIITGKILPDTHLQIPLELRIGTAGQGPGLSSVYCGLSNANVSFQCSWEWTESPAQG